MKTHLIVLTCLKVCNMKITRINCEGRPYIDQALAMLRVVGKVYNCHVYSNGPHTPPFMKLNVWLA